MGPHHVARCEYIYPGSDVRCTNRVSQKVYDYSYEKYKKVLCYGHQKAVDKLDNTYASVKEYEEITGKI